MSAYSTGRTRPFTGQEYLDSLRDGREIWIYGERVKDVTTHPAFRNAARSMAAIYDMKAADPGFSFTEKGEKYSDYFLRAKTREDLEKRMRLHRAIADMSHGLLGRSPDHVSSFVTGMATNPAALDTEKHKLGGNLVKYYDYRKTNDIFSTYAVLAPQAARKVKSTIHWVSAAHAVPADEAPQLSLGLGALGSRLAEPCGDHDEPAHTGLGALPDNLGHGRSRDGDDGQVDGPGATLDAGVGLPAEDLDGPRMDRVDRPREPVGHEVGPHYAGHRVDVERPAVYEWEHLHQGGPARWFVGSGRYLG